MFLPLVVPVTACGEAVYNRKAKEKNTKAKGRKEGEMGSR